MSSSSAPDVVKDRYVVYTPLKSLSEEHVLFITMNAEVDEVKTAIRALASYRGELATGEFHLFKCGTISVDTESSELFGHVRTWLGSQRSSMKPSRSLADYFPTGPAPKNEHVIDIVIATDSILESRDVIKALPSTINRETIASLGRKQGPPSAGATTKARCETQKASKLDAIYNCRPLELAALPITIYHPVFAKFLRLMAEPPVFKHQELDCAQTFISQATEYYCDEHKRVGGIRGFNVVHESILRSTALSCESSKILPNGTVLSANIANGRPAICALLELKNEIGDGGCDPIAQAECAYRAVCSSEEYKSIRNASCCPAFLVGIAGPNIIISGAVFADQIIAQTLTDYISVVPRLELDGRSPFSSATHRVATLFHALKTCIQDLENYYGTVVKAVFQSTSKPPSFISPHFSKYVDSSREFELTYKKRLTPDFKAKAVFEAEAKSKLETAKVVVKFAHLYGREAHELLARDLQAPKLRYCNYEPDVGMWVIVMDYVDAASIEAKLTDPVHIEALRAAVKTLHQNNLVFGDLRSPNVMVKSDGIILIDFDWAGEWGKARYPADIFLGGSSGDGNSGDGNAGDDDFEKINWHKNVERGGLIDIEHDEHMFRVLTDHNL